MIGSIQEHGHFLSWITPTGFPTPLSVDWGLSFQHSLLESHRYEHVKHRLPQGDYILQKEAGLGVGSRQKYSVREFIIGIWLPFGFQSKLLLTMKSATPVMNISHLRVKESWHSGQSMSKSSGHTLSTAQRNPQRKSTETNPPIKPANYLKEEDPWGTYQQKP